MGEAMYEAWTDGSCMPNPGRGGWAFILKGPDVETAASGFEPDTTNNRMEFLAVIKAIKAVPYGAHIIVRSDSQLVVNVLRGLWKPKKNMDLVRIAASEIKMRKVRMMWVRGHAGDPMNERVDALAVKARQ